MKSLLDRITIILHRPLHPGNVGSVARAMKNMGLSRLRLVTPCDFRSDMGEWMAVSAKDILHRAEVFEDLRAAASGSNFIVGTIPPDRPRFISQGFTPSAMAERLLKSHPDDRVSIIFGPEDKGLTNLELDLCHEFVSIPSHPDYPSLNLAQSVMVIAYEIFSAAGHQERTESRPLAEVISMEQMFRHFEETLSFIGFLDRDNPDHIMRDLRRIFGRARLDEREVKILRGILRQVRWAARRSGIEDPDERSPRQEG
ncbi:MAG: RNA methyltransferase [bacterium]